MLRYHMLVITRDNGLKRSIKRLTTATGATADFAVDTSQMTGTRAIDLAIYDARSSVPDRRFFTQLPPTARIMYIVAGDRLIERLTLFEDARVASLFCHDDRFDDDEFISSATKALRGEVFGLQKYFPWGVTTFTMLIKNYDEKTRAIDIMMRYAGLAGVRGPVRDRIQLVADELMMNALYHAPVDQRGNELYAARSPKELAQLPEVSPIQVQYGCSGRYFGLAVRDGFGSLRRDKALDYLLRARTGATIENKATGAGLGLVSVLSSVSKLVFNLAPAYSTEVISLFDMELFARGKVGARSMHLFTASVGKTGEDEIPEDDAAAAPAPRSSGWFLAAMLGAIVAAMATAVAMRHVGNGKPAPAVATKPAAEAATLTVMVEPSSATLTVDGAPATAGSPIPLTPGKSVAVEVKASGYKPWARTIDASQLATSSTIFVALSKGH